MKASKVIAALLCVLLLTGAALAEGEFPTLNEAGFLDEGEFVYEAPETGVWRYVSPTLRVEILRYEQAAPIKEVWYEAEIFAAEGELFHCVPWSENKRMTNLNYPYKIARKNQTVFAISADFAHLRISKRMGTGVGIILRDGKVVSAKTHARTKKGFPNLDTLALFPDGRMMTAVCDEYTADEYLEMGAADVLAFGPWLIHAGTLNPDLAKATSEHAQRAAIGMAEPGHYWAMMLEGRSKTSKGANVEFLAEKLLEHGCTEALNLDGGQSACMLFMGRQVNIVLNASGRPASARKAAEILGIGASDQVPGSEDKVPMGY